VIKKVAGEGGERYCLEKSEGRKIESNWWESE
jgi:hypothetical protein